MKRRGLWKRGRTGVAAAVCLCALLAALPAVAADYFVSKQGNDANNGQAKETAFLTIEKGVNTLSPGDTLTIGPGEYFESVSREGLGSADADTVIRAEIPGTVLMRGDADLPEIKKVEGYRFIHAVACDEEPRGVLEHDTLSILTKRPTILDVEYEPGAWYYDAAQKTVYLSSTDLRSPAQRRYTAAVSGETGIRLNNAKRVVIEGVAIGGFYPGWSILMDGAASCTVRDCAMYMGTGGICIDHSGGNNVVERCESYGHTFGGIVFYRAKDDIARNCRTYETKLEGSEHFCIMHYFNMPGTLLIQDCISWGQNFDFSVKPSQQERLERCVALGFVRVGNLFNNLIGSGNEYGRSLRQASADNILFLREEDLDQDFEFADPLNLDFRLQADSRFRGAGPDGTD